MHNGDSLLETLVLVLMVPVATLTSCSCQLAARERQLSAEKYYRDCRLVHGAVVSVLSGLVLGHNEVAHHCGLHLIHARAGTRALRIALLQVKHICHDEICVCLDQSGPFQLRGHNVALQQQPARILKREPRFLAIAIFPKKIGRDLSGDGEECEIGAALPWG